jgi:hypothetical protein
MNAGIISTTELARPCGTTLTGGHTQPQGTGSLENTVKRYACAIYRDCPLEIRLWSRVAINDKTGCWEWTGHRKTVDGSKWHGTIAAYSNHNAAVHRVVYEMLVADIPAGLCVCHHCDNPICVRPDHLFVGTMRDNVLDMFAKGRGNRPFGENSPSSKLTLRQARQIKRLGGTGLLQREIAALCGVSESIVWSILNGKTWKRSVSCG